MGSSILIIDDSEIVRTQVIEILERVAVFDDFYQATDGVQALGLLGAACVDVILCDLLMPNMDGFQFLKHIKSEPDYKDIPVIILSGKGETELKIKGLENGASDYVTKPFDAGELIARITVQLNIKALQDDLRQTNKLLMELSITDYLTHLYNRRYMMDSLEIEFLRTLRNNGNLCLVLMDIDHFKSVNDTYGHQDGDMVLAAVAEAVQVELRRYDMAARYGGEEFALVLPETTLAEGQAVAERLRQAVQEITFPAPMENLMITISQGIAALPPHDIHSVDFLIKMADDALYRAKQNGRNRVELMAFPTREVKSPGDPVGVARSVGIR